MEEDKNSEPQTPEHHLFHSLHIQHPKYENEFVEDEVPKLVLQVLSGKKVNTGTRVYLQTRVDVRFPRYQY